MKKNYEYLLLFLILLAGAWLRLHNLGDISFSNDELSALTRARFDTFHELVEKGIKVDGHPALVQTMIWFTIHHINDEVFTVRFPFAVSGIISILLIFLLAKRWFGRATGLLSAAALATLQFPLLYSQTARPYTIGLMFTLALAYFWTRLVFDEKKNRWIIIAFILASAGCIYTHYFSFMLAGIIGISGLFFMKRENYIQYIIFNIIPLLLFIPSIPIFQQQFGYEGIGGWLPPPDNKFFLRFFNYGFNNSWIHWGLFIFCIGGTLKYTIKNSSWKKFHTLSIAWYLFPIFIGYSYSIWKAPVLQFSTLIFSFPFLIIFAFSIPNEKWVTNKIIVLLTLAVLSVGVYSTVYEKQYYKTKHFGVFKELAEKTKEWDQKYGKENIVKLFTLSNPAYINYYFKKLHHDPQISIYTDDEKSKYGLLSTILDSSSAKYFLYAWTNAVHAYETPELILEKYPVVIERDTFFNSEITLFGTGNTTSNEMLISQTDFEKDNWGYETANQSKDVAHSGLNSQKLNEQTEFSVGYKNETANLHLDKTEMIKAETWFYCTDTIRNASLVIAFLKKGEMVSYVYAPLLNFYTSKNKWTRAILFSEIPDENCEMRIYVWNQTKETFYIDDLSVKSTPRNSLYRP